MGCLHPNGFIECSSRSSLLLSCYKPVESSLLIAARVIVGLFSFMFEKHTHNKQTRGSHGVWLKLDTSTEAPSQGTFGLIFERQTIYQPSTSWDKNNWSDGNDVCKRERRYVFFKKRQEIINRLKGRPAYIIHSPSQRVADKWKEPRIFYFVKKLSSFFFSQKYKYK